MRREFYAAILVLLAIQIVNAQPKSTKRGIAYGHNSAQDLAALSSGISWYYNWFHSPEVSNFDDYSIDFVPMAWTSSFDKDAMHSFLSSHPNVKYILGWNEPNFTTQANLTPKQAAAHWKDIEALASEFNLKIVSPAVNYCDQCVSEDGTSYGDPVKYLDAFFAACTDCKVDYIAIHCYMNNISALQWYVGLFKKYGKPIWLTEFCSWEGNAITAESQQSFLIGAIDYLENDKDVYRYSWFTGRQDSAYPYNALLGGQGQLTDIGKLYINTKPHDSTVFVGLPARIEMENYSKMSGIMLEKTSDQSGIVNVGYIDAGDWLEYNVNALAKDTFNLKLRVAANQSGSVSLIVDDVLKETLAIPATGGWQSWTSTDFKNQLVLEGKHKIRIKANTGGYNLNWLDIYKPVPEVVSGINHDVQKLIYPNPVRDALLIDKALQANRFELFDLRGELLLSLNHCPEIDFSQKRPGIYILKITTTTGVVTQKVVKE